MGLLKYTTEVPVERSVAEICAMLGEARADGIMQRFNSAREVVAIEFELKTPHGPVWFRLPADTAKALKTLERQALSGKIEKRYAKADQAKRVAWRILTQWVQAQLALIEISMVEPEQVFLSYAVDRASDRTFYELMVEAKFARLALPAPRSKVVAVLEGEVVG